MDSDFNVVSQAVWDESREIYEIFKCALKQRCVGIMNFPKTSSDDGLPVRHDHYVVLNDDDSDSGPWLTSITMAMILNVLRDDWVTQQRALYVHQCLDGLYVLYPSYIKGYNTDDLLSDITDRLEAGVRAGVVGRVGEKYKFIDRSSKRRKAKPNRKTKKKKSRQRSGRKSGSSDRSGSSRSDSSDSGGRRR